MGILNNFESVFSVKEEFKILTRSTIFSGTSNSDFHKDLYFFSTLEETIYYNPFSALTRSLSLAEAKAQGKMLTKDEWSSSKYFRDGMSYPEKGISEPAAKILAERYDERETRKAILKLHQINLQYYEQTIKTQKWILHQSMISI